MAGPNDVPGRPLLEANPGLCIPYLVILCTATLVGFTGNVTVIVTFLRRKSMTRVGNEFIVNLALADLCVVAVANPLCIIGVVKGEEFFADKPFLCSLIACTCLTACFCAFFSLTGVTINRYICVCRNTLYNRIFTRGRNIAMCVSFWVMAFLCEMPNFLWEKGHYFDTKNHSCIWNRKANFTYTLIAAVLFITGPLLGMAWCYISIFTTVKTAKARIHTSSDNNSFFNSKLWKATIRSSKTLFVVFLVFVVCWVPYAIVIAIDFADQLSVGVHLYVTLLAHIHSSANAIVYLVTNRHVRQNMISVASCREDALETTTTKTPNGNVNKKDDNEDGTDKNLRQGQETNSM